MINKSIFLHAGWNKTATTFLQQEVFMPIFGEDLISPNVRINDLQTKNFAESPLLISDESLLGVTIFTRHECRTTQRFNFLDNWAKIAPNTKFILGERRHDQLIESLYRQYLQVGGDLRAEEFIDISNDKGFLKIDELLYEPILSRVFELFSEEHFIYDFDLFKENPAGLVTDLLSFVEISEPEFEKLKPKALCKQTKNKSIGYRSGSVLRNINKFVSSPLQPNKPVPISLFKLITLGKTPRQIFQSLPDKQPRQNFTQNIFDDLQHKFECDWSKIKQDYLDKNHRKS